MRKEARGPKSIHIAFLSVFLSACSAFSGGEIFFLISRRSQLVGSSSPPRILFVTGRLAEFALRQVLEDLAPRAGFAAEVAVLPISVAALMPPKWVARHLVVPPGIDRVILPGLCLGDLSPVVEKTGGTRVERGP